MLFDTKAQGRYAFALDFGGARFAAERLVAEADAVLAHRSRLRTG